MIEPPPPVLIDARVLEYAIIDNSVRFTGALRLYSGDKRVGPVSALAICEDFSGGNLLLVHCNQGWEVEGVQAWNAPDVQAVTSVAEMKSRAERYYDGVSKKWIQHPSTQSEAEKYRDEIERAMACSFCGRGPHKVETLIEGRGVRICGECIREFHAELGANND